MTKTLAAFGMAGLILSSTVAEAAAAPAVATPAPAVAQGPAVPGVCLMSVNQAVAQSNAGQWVRTRFEQIVGQVRAELNPEEQGIAADDKALSANRATMDQPTFQSKVKALQDRASAFQQKADLRQRELKATQDKAFNRVAQELEPIAQQLYQSHRCSVMVDKSVVLFPNPDMDLTPAAITALNAKITQFPFEREHLDTNIPQGQ